VPEVRIAAEPRTEFGKGGARRTRRAGNIPAVLYGHGTDPRHIALPSRAFESALRTDGANVLLEVQIDGDSELALPKSIQRDPVRGVIEHIDLILVRRGERISVDVQVQIAGEIAPGGLLDQQVNALSVMAEATNIPSEFTVSVEGLEIGASVHASEVDLPDGVELAGDPEQVVAHILAAPTAEQMEADLDSDVAEIPTTEAEAAAGDTEGGEAGADGDSNEGAAAESDSDQS
jgi:large subunit ribosomal protein L25